MVAAADTCHVGRVLLTTVALLVLAAVMLVAAIAVVCSCFAIFVRGPRAPLMSAVLLFVCPLALLLAGAAHFSSAWPGSAGHPWAGQGLVPPQLASFAWASTLFVTSYWAHPAVLSHFPSAELAGMAVGPVLLCAALVGAIRAVKLIELSRSACKLMSGLVCAGAVSMVVFISGCAACLLGGSTGPGDLYRMGAIDALDVGVMVTAVVVLLRAASCSLSQFGQRTSGTPASGV